MTTTETPEKAPEKGLRDLSQHSLNEIENFYRQGVISEAETVAYIRKWNQGPHFTQAVLSDGAIRNFDPEKSGVLYRHLQEKFQLNLPPIPSLTTA